MGQFVSIFESALTLCSTYLVPVTSQSLFVSNCLWSNLSAPTLIDEPCTVFVSSMEQCFFFSFVYHRVRSLAQFVGAMLWSMAQLRRCQLRMVVCVVGNCWWCGQLSVLARHTHMPHCPPVLLNMVDTEWQTAKFTAAPSAPKPHVH